jgi:translation initiation factor IF-3
LIDQQHNQVGIVDRNSALEMAREAGLDLVEIAPNSEPPVCRIMDYGKYLYDQKRKFREGRKKSHHHSATLKEVRLRPETDKHDLDIKLKHAHEFLEKGHKVQFTMLFRGRQMLHQERGYKVFDYITEAMEDVAKIEQPCKMAHRRMILLLVPK